MNTIAIVVLVFIHQALALKCTFTYSSDQKNESRTISDPKEGGCFDFEFQAYKIINRCYVDARAYVDAGCGGKSELVESGKTYTGRHDIFKSIEFA